MDSGRLSEPFRYIDSPLTTPCAARPFAGRPPRGQVPPAGPGVLVPDVPVALPEPRIRAGARHGFLLLVADGADVAAVRRVAAEAPGPARASSHWQTSTRTAP